MNDHSGGFPTGTSALAISKAGPPAIEGLRDLALTGPAKREGGGFDLAEYWRIITKWWWLILAIVVSCVLAAVVVSLMMTPMYRAKATLEINPEGVQVVKMGEIESAIDDRSFLATQTGLLRSRSLAERVVRSTNLAAQESFANPEASREERERQATASLMARVKIEPERESRLIAVSVASPDPVLSARIANAYADNFIQSNLERRFEGTSYARNFLEQRIATVKARLEDSERQLVDYAKRQGIISLNVDTGSGTGGRSEQSIDAASLVSLNEALSSARAERIAAEQRFRQSSGAQSSASVIADPTVQALQQQRSQLEAEYQEKLGLFRPEFPAMAQLRDRIDTLNREIASRSRNVAGSASGSLRADYAAAAARENALQARVNSLKADLLNLRERSIQYTILQREVDTNRSLYDALLQRFKEVGVAGGVGTNAVSIVDRAQVPGGPFRPNLPLNLAIGLLAGLFLGFGTAFVLEWLDDTIKTPDDLRSKLGLAPLGVIPIAPKGSGIEENLQDARSQISEAYQSVRAALQFSTSHGVPKTLLITSTRAAEGKSSSAFAIATAIATLGPRVLLIDSDLRKPTFRGPSSEAIGLSNILAGSEDLEAAIHPTSENNLFLLTAGSIPPNPAELLAGGRFPTLLARVSEMFDHIVIDAPPVLGLADAPLLSSYCEATIMIVESGAIRRVAAQNSLNRLRGAGAQMMGGVLTKFSATRSGYGYGYGYGYGESEYSYREGKEPKRQIRLLQRS